MRQVAVGWLVRYEIWSTSDTPQLLVDLRIPLETEEVLLQMRHSLWRDRNLDSTEYTTAGAREWKIQFPMVISLSGHIFVVLRTVYLLKLAQNCEYLTATSCKLPVDELGSISPNWSVSNPEQPWSDNPVYRDDLYLFYLSISANGRLIFFMDQDLLSGVHIVVFGVHLATRIKVSVLGYHSTYIPTVTGRFGQSCKVAFHPSKSLVFFSVGRAIYLYAFAGMLLFCTR